MNKKNNILVSINICIIILGCVLMFILLKKNIKNEKFTKTYIEYTNSICEPNHIKYTNIGDFSRDYADKDQAIIDAKENCNNKSKCKGFTLQYNQFMNVYKYVLKKDIVSHKIKPSEYIVDYTSCFMKN